MNAHPAEPTHPWMVLPLLALALGLQLALALPALAKSYTMGPVVIEAQVKPDGSMSVVEQRQFDFSGDYSRVFWDLAHQERSGCHGERGRGDRGRAGAPARPDGLAPGGRPAARHLLHRHVRCG